MRLRLLLLLLCALAAPARGEDFAAIATRARGQTVYFNAWGGSRQINDYIAWAGAQLEERYGIDLVHVKLTDTAEAVARVRAEKAAGRTEGGTVDLIWINGENFAAMKQQGLLCGPFTQLLPNFALVDTAAQPTTLVDFTDPDRGPGEPVGHGEVRPVLRHARGRRAAPLDPALLDWAKAHPGRFTYPAPPDFIGSTFLKHVLYRSRRPTRRVCSSRSRRRSSTR